jgi:hypothetical protein
VLKIGSISHSVLALMLLLLFLLTLFLLFFGFFDLETISTSGRPLAEPLFSSSSSPFLLAVSPLSVSDPDLPLVIGSGLSLVLLDVSVGALGWLEPPSA